MPSVLLGHPAWIFHQNAMQAKRPVNEVNVLDRGNGRIGTGNVLFSEAADKKAKKSNRRVG